MFVLLIDSVQVPVPAPVVHVLVLAPFTDATAPTGTSMDPLSPKLELTVDGRFGPLWYCTIPESCHPFVTPPTRRFFTKLPKSYDHSALKMCGRSNGM